MTTPAIDIAIIKDDLGITGGADDAWLSRRIDAIWEKFQEYTHRELGPVESFTDDWSRVFEQGELWGFPPYGCGPRASIYLTHFPVVEITAAMLDGVAVADLTQILVDKKTGLIQSISGVAGSHDLSRELAGRRFSITYTAGLGNDLGEDIPKPLYEAVIGILAQMYAVRKNASSGIGVGGTFATSIVVQDVGQVNLGANSTAFEHAAMKGTNLTDPFLGPYTSMLEPYVDRRLALAPKGRPTSVKNP